MAYEIRPIRNELILIVEYEHGVFVAAGNKNTVHPVARKAIVQSIGSPFSDVMIAL